MDDRDIKAQHFHGIEHPGMHGREAQAALHPGTLGHEYDQHLQGTTVIFRDLRKVQRDICAIEQTEETVLQFFQAMNGELAIENRNDTMFNLGSN